MLIEAKGIEAMNYYPPCCPVCGSDATKCEHRPKPVDDEICEHVWADSPDVSDRHCVKCFTPAAI